MIARALLLLSLLAWSCAPAQQEPSTAPADAVEPLIGIRGHVSDGHGGPAAAVAVYAYRNQRSNLRGPADFEALSAADGSYFLDLVEGDYYLVARLRQAGTDAGPPQAGDAWALPAKNPVTVKPGEITTVDFVLQGISQPMLMREGTLTGGDSGFTGLLVDGAGEPLPGAFVIAYPDADFQRMPEATSPAVGADGRFHLFVERPGRWCLAARTRTRGQPIAGEPYGLLGKGDDSCRLAVSGEVQDVGLIRLTPYRR